MKNESSSSKKSHIRKIIDNISANKIASNAFFIFLLIFYLFSAFATNYVSKSTEMINLLGRNLPFSSFAGVISSIANMTLICLVVFYRKKGFYTCVIIYCIHFIRLFTHIFFLHSLPSIPGLSTFGEAIGKGKDASDSMREALASMAQQVLDQLPTMFLQAGLQLIAQGQWALGLGFVAAGGASSFVSGFVSGRTSGEAEANALGGVYGDDSYAAFAKGGAFTNSIVSSPTFFRFARGGGFGTGLMGEAGPEAIMPLTRGADGSLGVSASGFGMKLQVVINNYGSEEVKAEETTGENGQRRLEITIGSMINRHLSGGMADKAMSSRYGIKAKGV